MKHSYHAEREHSNHPPITKAGRPPGRSYSPGTEKPHRSSSRSSRHSNHSRRRSVEMSEADESIDDLAKRSAGHGVIRVIKNTITSFTHGSPGRGSTKSNRKSGESNEPNRPRSPRSPVHEPSQLATQPNGTTHTFPVDGQDRQDTLQIPPSAQNPLSRLPTESPDANRVYTPNNFQLEQSEELQPDSQVHQTQGIAASRNENISYGQNGLEMTLQEQVVVMDDLIAEKKSLSQQLEAERQHHQKEIDYWRHRTSEAASKSANLVPGMPLSQPETELRNEWRNLAFDVRNFVDNHFNKVSTSKLEAWGRENGDWLRRITPTYQQVVGGKRSGIAMVEAAVWYGLWRAVLGGLGENSPMLWAGAYQRSLRILVSELQQDQRQKKSEQFAPLFQQWGALTANLIETLRTSDHHNQRVHHVVQELEEMLYACRSAGVMYKSDTYRQDLRALVTKAIRFDFNLSGQTAEYFIGWPSSDRSNVPFDQRTMQVSQRSSQSSRTVKFILQPCFFRVGRQGDSTTVVDECTVWLL